jgi:signal transduction histidine kinase
MSRFRDQLVPIVAGGLVVVVAVAVVLLLKSAGDQGTTALRQAKLAQVQATADSFNERVNSSLVAVKGLGQVAWQLTPNSNTDKQVLNSYNVDPNAQSGFFLVNSSGTITTGVLLRPGKLGSKFDPPALQQVKAKLAADSAVVLPVSNNGSTTELPSYDFVVPIIDPNTKTLRGELVLEQAVTASSSFEKEISQLAQHDPSSAAWFFIDSNGTVVASTTDSGLGKPVENHQYLTGPSGLSDIGPKLVIAADIPSLGWRVIFREDRSQFDAALSDPLQRAGLILVLLLLAVGLTLIVILVRRLRESREQERRLRNLTRSQAEFISVVSHELRTPVAGVLGFLQTTVDHWTELSDEERLTTVRRAVTNARRLQAMTRDVLDTDSIESGQFGYSFQRVDLGAELQTAVEGQEGVGASHVITLNTPPEHVLVDADPDRLQQVLTNLLDNARRNAPPNEPIVIDTEVVHSEGAPRVRVSVIDRGPGVGADEVERIFNKFVRGNDNAVSGTGLGLYIVRKIVESHHGRIWCESTPGVRTAFIFELPLAEAGSHPDTTAVVGAH